MTHKEQILKDGPKTNRWIDRAEWLYYVAERRGVEENTKAAYKALGHFVEAKDLRRCYHQSTQPRAAILHSAAREHRRGVKAFREADEMIFGKRES